MKKLLVAVLFSGTALAGGKGAKADWNKLDLDKNGVVDAADESAAKTPKEKDAITKFLDTHGETTRSVTKDQFDSHHKKGTEAK